jgi:hypothetical protein
MRYILFWLGLVGLCWCLSSCIKITENMASGSTENTSEDEQKKTNVETDIKGSGSLFGF